MGQPRVTTEEIDGHQFNFQRLPPDEALDRCAELQSLLLGSLSVDFGKPGEAGDKEMTAAQMGQAFASGIASLSRGLNRVAFKQARALLLDPAYTSIGSGDDARKLTSEEMLRREVEAPTLLKAMLAAARVHYLPVFLSAASGIGAGDWTPARLLSVASTLAPRG